MTARPLTICYRGNFQPDLPVGVAPWSTETHLAASFEQLGHRVTRLQEDAVGWDETLSACTDADLFVWTTTYAMAAGWDSVEAAEVVAKLGAMLPTAGVHLDRWFGLDREAQIAESPYFRLGTVFTADGDNDERWAEAGVNHRWLRPGVYGPECVPGQRRPQYTCDIAFVGSWRWYHPEHPRIELVNWLRRTYGRSRCHFWPRGRAVRGQALNDLYASAKVIVGDSCFAATSRLYVSDRLYETTGRGGFTVFPYVEVAAQDFTDGVHLRFYEPGNFTELGQLIDYYTDPAHDAERRTIAAAGQAEALAHHTYAHRMAELLAILCDEGVLCTEDVAA